MSQWKGYCYIKRSDLEKGRARVFFQYDTRKRNSKERVEVRKTNDDDKDLLALLAKIKNEVDGRLRPRIEKETETVGHQGTNAITIKRYFICLQ